MCFMCTRGVLVNNSNLILEPLRYLMDMFFQVPRDLLAPSIPFSPQSLKYTAKHCLLLLIYITHLLDPRVFTEVHFA